MSGRIRKKSIWIKMYIVVLFFCGIGIWFFTKPITSKQVISIDIILDKKIVNVLVANSIVQDDILNQYTKEKNTRSDKWNEFYRTIKIKSDKTMQALELEFKNIAHSMGVDLNKVNKVDGSVVYKFYSLDRDYSSITLIYKS
jgi:hypothetical protein